MSAALTSFIRIKLRQLGSRLLSSLPGDGGVPPPKPGSAADLLQFFQGEQKTWKSTIHRSKGITSTTKRTKRDTLEGFRTDAYTLPPFFSMLSGPEQTLTRKALNAITRAEFSFRARVPRKKKLQEAREAITELKEVVSVPLSPTTLSMIIRRVARLVDNPILRPTSTEGKSVVDVGQVDFLSELLPKGMIALREREASINTEERENSTANTSANSSASPAAVLDQSIGNKDNNGEKQEVVWEAALASNVLFSSALINLRLPKQDIDLLATFLLRGKRKWQAREVVMMANAMGRLGALPLEGEFHAALRDDAAWHFLSIDPPEINPSEMGTILRSMAQCGYHPGDRFIHDVVAKLRQPKYMDEIKPTEAAQVLYALSRFSYAPHCGVPLKHHRTWRWEVKDSLRASRLIEDIVHRTYVAVNTQGVSGGGGGGGAGGGDGGISSTNAVSPPSTSFYSKHYSKPHGLSAEREAYDERLDSFLQQQQQQVGDQGGPMRFRSLRELQTAARQWEAQRRKSLEQSSPSALSLEGTVVKLWGFPEESQLSRLTSLSSSVGLAALVERTAVRRAERAEAERLVQDTEAILKSMRLQFGNKINQEAPNSTNISKIQEKDRSSRNNTIPLGEEEPDADQLVHRLLTGAWPAVAEETESEEEEEGNSSSSGGRGRRVLRLGKMLAEARIQPDSGRTLISPLYDPSLLYGSLEPDTEPPLLSVLDATFPLDAAGMRLIAEQNGGVGFGDLPPGAGEVAAEVIGALLRKSLQRVPEDRPELVLQLPRYMGYLRHWDPEILAIVAQRMAELSSFSVVRPQVLVEVLWAYAILNEPMPSELLKSLVDYLIAFPPSQQPWIDYARIMWCLAAMGQLNVDTCRILGDKVVQVLEAHPGSYARIANPGGLSQIFQASLHLEATTGVPHQDLLPEEFHEAAAAAWHGRSSMLSTSMTQRDVANVLRTLGVRCEVEYAPPNTHVIIDIAATLPGGAKLAVEVDGPYHFATNVRDKALGAVGLRNTLLEHSGWPVVSIPLYEFSDLKSLEEEEHYLIERVVRPLERQLEVFQERKEQG